MRKGPGSCTLGYRPCCSGSNDPEGPWHRDWGREAGSQGDSPFIYSPDTFRSAKAQHFPGLFQLGDTLRQIRSMRAAGI